MSHQARQLDSCLTCDRDEISEGLEARQRTYLKVGDSIRAALAGCALGKYTVSSINCSGGRTSGGISTSSLHMKANELAPGSARQINAAV